MPDNVMVRRFQAGSMGEVFRLAADWLDEPSHHSLTIESVNHVQLPRAPGGAELLSIFFSKAGQAATRVQAAASERTWNSVTRGILDALDIGYAPTGRQLTARHTDVGQWILLPHAVQMVKSIVYGPHKAIDPPDNPDIVSDAVDTDRLHDAAVKWFGEIVRNFGGPQVFADRTRVLRTVAVRVALASLGTAFYSQDENAVANARAVLTDVDWTVSPAWQGIGGQVVATGSGLSMTSGSGKSSISRAVQALKPDTEAGRLVRTGMRVERPERPA